MTKDASRVPIFWHRNAFIGFFCVFDRGLGLNDGNPGQERLEPGSGDTIVYWRLSESTAEALADVTVPKPQACSTSWLELITTLMSLTDQLSTACLSHLANSGNAYQVFFLFFKLLHHFATVAHCPHIPSPNFCSLFWIEDLITYRVIVSCRFWSNIVIIIRSPLPRWVWTCWFILVVAVTLRFFTRLGC